VFPRVLLHFNHIQKVAAVKKYMAARPKCKYNVHTAQYLKSFQYWIFVLKYPTA